MKLLVLGGCGIQGRAAVYDLSRSKGVSEVVCADQSLDALRSIEKIAEMSKIRPVKLDASRIDALVEVFRGCDAAVDLLPRQYTDRVCMAAMQTGVSVVNTNYAYPVAHLDEQAQEAGIAILPECGLDPGIDLVIYGNAAERFDEINVLNSYCGGFPEAGACNNSLNYKISWVWEGVLSSTRRESRIIMDGEVVEIPAADQHNPEWVHALEFPGLGSLEAIPNGDAVFFTDLLGVTPTIRETGRYSLRWPGWSAFWRPLKELGFLDDKPVDGLPCRMTPLQFMDKHLGPRLQYDDDEKDIVAMVNVFEGKKGGKRTRLTSRLLMERDLTTGLMAMSRGVGYPASIAAQMIGRGDITAKGLLRPTRHIPYGIFTDELARRGIIIEETEGNLA